jgi:hypothetical protein
MIIRYCKLCDLEMEHIESDPDVGIVGGWYCEHCAISYDDWDYYESDL